jgi:hypothetical protein
LQQFVESNYTKNTLKRSELLSSNPGLQISYFESLFGFTLRK